MASLQVNDKIVQKRGPSDFKVCGQLHRRIGTMLDSNRQPKFLQTYFMKNIINQN